MRFSYRIPLVRQAQGYRWPALSQHTPILPTWLAVAIAAGRSDLAVPSGNVRWSQPGYRKHGGRAWCGGGVRVLGIDPAVATYAAKWSRADRTSPSGRHAAAW